MKWPAGAVTKKGTTHLVMQRNAAPSQGLQVYLATGKSQRKLFPAQDSLHLSAPGSHVVHTQTSGARIKMMATESILDPENLKCKHVSSRYKAEIVTNGYLRALSFKISFSSF